MKILLCIKQIPDTNDVRWSKDNNIIRDGVISVINPYDLYGIMASKTVKEKLPQSKVTILTMGPQNSIESLRYALNMTGDEGYLLTDRFFVGSDTLITAKTLSYAIKNVLGDFDLIITGQFASDGDTAQTPYCLANLLNIANVGYVHKIDDVNENRISLTSIKDDGVYKIKAKYPLLISMANFEGEIYKPKIKDYIMGANKKITTINANDILLNQEESGLRASPTYVKKAYRPLHERNCKFVNSIYDLIEEMKV